VCLYDNTWLCFREDVDVLKEGEIDKVKQYRALCWTQDPITDDQLVDLSGIKVTGTTPAVLQPNDLDL